MKSLNVILLISEATAVLVQSCGNVTDRHWDLFSHANEFTNYIRFVGIKTNGSFVSDFMDQVLQESNQRFGNPAIVHYLDPSYEEPTYDYLELFSWTGEKLPLREGQVNSTMVIHNYQRLSSLQKDESNFLVFVTIDSIDSLDQFLRGSPRKPFHKTRGRYVVAIAEEYSDIFYSKAASILRRMWVDYGIHRILLLSSCQDQHFYQFNPFSPSKHTLNTDEGIIDVDIWGRMETSYLNDSTSLTHWAQNYPFTYNGYPMTSVMFPRLPTVVKWTELPKPFAESYFCDARPYSKDYGGFDAITFGNLLQILNFTPYTFRPVNEYGYQLDNGTYIGSIGDVLYSKAGFSSNGRFVQDYGTSEIEFMYPTFFDKFCIIAPKAQQIPQWLAVFRCFNPYVWTLFLVSTTILGFIWYLFKKWTCYLRKNQLITKKTDEIISPLHDTIPVAIIDMWLIMTSGVPSILPYHSVERLFMTGCLLLSLTIGGTFQGSLTTSYSTKSYYADIHTLKQLDESGLPIGTSSRNLANILDSDNNPVLNSLQKKFIISSVPVIDQTAFKRDICCIERASDITVIMTTTFELADGSALLHVIEECPRSYHLAFIVRKGWPFLTRFNEIVMRFSEAGFLFLWYEQAETAIILSERIKRLKDLKDTLQAFSLEDMQTAFYILLIGLIFCTIIFFFELWIGRRKERIRIREKTKDIGDVMCNAIKPRKVFYIN